MRRLLVFVPFLAIFFLVPTQNASAQCVTIGAKICQGGYWYVCQPCGSEKCWIMTGPRCLRDDLEEEFGTPVTRNDGPRRLALASQDGNRRAAAPIAMTPRRRETLEHR